MTIDLPKHIHRVKTRHGKTLFYYQVGRGSKRPGPRTRLPDDPHDPAFWKALRAAQGFAVEEPGTFTSLIYQYRSSPEYGGLSAASRRDYDRYLDQIKSKWGGLQVSGLRPSHVLKLRDAMAATPGAADHMVSVLRTVIEWGIPRDFADTNPATSIKKLARGGDGYQPWPQWALDLVTEHGPPAMVKAVALGFYTGQRRGDVVAMRAEHIENGGINVTQSKTGKRLFVPLHRELQSALAGVTSGPLVTTGTGEAYKNGASFTAAWGRWLKPLPLYRIRKAGLTFHGLRKNAVNALLEAGCKHKQVSSITGHSLVMVEHYSRNADQRKMALQAMRQWEKL